MTPTLKKHNIVSYLEKKEQIIPNLEQNIVKCTFNRNDLRNDNVFKNDADMNKLRNSSIQRIYDRLDNEETINLDIKHLSKENFNMKINDNPLLVDFLSKDNFVMQNTTKKKYFYSDFHLLNYIQDNLQSLFFFL